MQSAGSGVAMGQVSDGCLITPISGNTSRVDTGLAGAEGIMGLILQGNRFSSAFKRMWGGPSGHCPASYGPNGGAVGCV